jgi:hypothetical protein
MRKEFTTEAGEVTQRTTEFFSVNLCAISPVSVVRDCREKFDWIIWDRLILKIYRNTSARKLP